MILSCTVVKDVIWIVLFSQRIYFGESSGRLAHIELAGDDVGDQAGTVFAEKIDFSLGLCHCFVNFAC